MSVLLHCLLPLLDLQLRLWCYFPLHQCVIHLWRILVVAHLSSLKIQWRTWTMAWGWCNWCGGKDERPKDGAEGGLLRAGAGTTCEACPGGWSHPCFTFYLFHSFTGCWWFLPADGGSLPGHKSAMDENEKKKIGAKAAPSSAQKALNDLRPFLRFADGMKDSDADLPKARSTLYHVHLRSLAAGANQSKQKKERQSSQPVSPTRDRVLGSVLGQPELAGFTPGLDPSPFYFTSCSPLPTN